MDVIKRIYRLKLDHMRRYGTHSDFKPNTVILGRQEFLELKSHRDSVTVCGKPVSEQDKDTVFGIEIVEAAGENCLRVGYTVEG